MLEQEDNLKLSNLTLSNDNRRLFIKGVCRGALLALSLRLTACGSEELLPRESISTSSQSGDATEDQSQPLDKLTPNQENPNTDSSKDDVVVNDKVITPEPELKTLLLSDIYAVSLYYDGTMGPQTGVITIDDIVAAQDKTYKFWHGHGGSTHSFTVTKATFLKIRDGEKVTVETSAVDDHRHTLFIDPSNNSYQVPGSSREVQVESV